MALDTRDKRASSIGFGLAFLLVLPAPNGAIDQGDRQQTAYSYRGISAQAGTTGSGAVTLPCSTVSGSGTVAVTGTAAVTTTTATVSGSGTIAVTGTGAVSTRAPTVAGTGQVPRTGTGAVTTPASTVAASGSTVGTTGTGAVTVPAPTVSGDGTVVWVSLFTAHVEIDTRDWKTPKVVNEEWTTR